MCPVGGIDFFRRGTLERKDHVDSAQHEHAVLHFDFAVSHGRQGAFTRHDPARLQRAPQGAEQSTAGRRDDVVDRRRVRVGHFTLDAVMTSDWSVSAEAHRLRFGRQMRQT